MKGPFFLPSRLERLNYISVQYLPDGDASIYKLHRPRKEPDRQASAPGGDKVNNVQGKNSCVRRLLVLSPPVWKTVADFYNLTGLEGYTRIPKAHALEANDFN